MKNDLENFSNQQANVTLRKLVLIFRATMLLLISVSLTVGAGCGTAKEKKKNTEFFTSGNREADQRASQKMAKAEQLSGTGEGSGEKKIKKAKPEKETAGGTNQAAQAEGKLSLFERLGGEKGIAIIVDDFLPRALQDPRVNWQRKGVKRGGFSFHRNESVSWNPTAEKIAQLKKHLVQFFDLATGGPTHYEGKSIKSTHAAMHISNAEFDAVIGDLKASLDKLKIPNQEQKELLAVTESTRPEIVSER